METSISSYLSSLSLSGTRFPDQELDQALYN